MTNASDSPSDAAVEAYADAVKAMTAEKAPAPPRVGLVTPLADDVPATPATPDPIREYLRTPYNLTTWRKDLRELRESVDTGVPPLADVGMRWVPGKVYSVIARPGHGKTTFLLEACCRYLEADNSRHAVFLSWEEPLADVVTSLLLRADAGAESPTGRAFGSPVLFPATVKKWGKGDENAPDFTERLTAAEQRLAPLLDRLHLLDGDRLGHTAQAVLAGLAAWMRERNAPRVGLVAVDYFQKLTGDRARSRQVELQGVADALRRFAKGARLSGELEEADTLDNHLAVPVLVGAQVNRTSTNRDAGNDGHPSGDDIREADDLLNDSDGVVALSWKAQSTLATGEETRLLRLSVPKNRNGAVREDVARMIWRPARRFLGETLMEGERVRWSRAADDAAENKKASGGSPFVGDPRQ